MLQLMRKHHKVAMIFVAIIVCITMVIYGQNNDHGGSSYTLKIGDKTYYQPDISAAGAIQQMAQSATNFSNDPPMKLMGLLMNARGTAQKVRGGEIENTLTNLVTVRESARELGVAVSDEDVQKAVQALPRMQTEGKFDRAKFDQVAGSDAAKRYFYLMMKDALLVDKLQKLVGGTMQATEYATNLSYNDQHAKTTLQAVIVPRKTHEAIKATDEDAQKYYDANKAKDPDETKNLNLLDPEMRSEPSRNLSYVKFNKVKRDTPEDISKLPADQQEAKRKEQEEKKKAWDNEDKKIISTAIALSNALVDENKPLSLTEAVESLKPKAEEFVGCEIKIAEKVIASAPPDDLKDAAAQLEEMIDSELGKGVVKTATGFIVYEGSPTIPSRLLTFEEAKPKLLEKLTKEQITAALTDAATGVRSKLQEALSAGKPFADALTAADVKATSYTYSQKNPAKNAPPYLPKLQQAVANIEAGTLTANAVEAGEDLAVVYLEKVELPQDPKMSDDKKILKRTSGYNNEAFRASPIFTSWFDKRREAIAPTFGAAQ